MGGRAHAFQEFLRRVAQKAAEDNIFFMAGSIAFSIILAVLPLVILTAGIAGYLAARLYDDPAAAVVDVVSSWLPEIGGDIDLLTMVRDATESIVAERVGYSLVGGLFFVWLSTRLVGTLRVTLREVFEVSRERGLLRGKIFDAQIVLVSGLLLAINVAVTVRLEALGAYGAADVFALEGDSLGRVDAIVAHVISFVSIWVALLLIYRYLTVRPIPWRLALIGATFSGVLQEVLKFLFSFYVISVADYGSSYGNLTNVAVLFLWIYYGAVVFVLGGEVAQVHAMSRARSMHGMRAVFSENE